jgi:CRP/FNR family transcriptional regulator
VKTPGEIRSQSHADMTLPPRCLACPVQASSLCGAIGEEAAKALAAISHRMRIPAGRAIYGATQPARSFAIIVSGVVKLVTAKPDGRQQIVGLQFPSDFVGRPLMEPTSLSAEAATTLELCCFSGRAFEALMRDHPDIERALLKRILGDLDRARDWAFLLGRTTAQEKVATLLHVIAERLTRPPSHEMKDEPRRIGLSLPLSRMEIAECLGLRLETVCRQMTRLRSQGIIATSGRRRFEVLDMDALKQCAPGLAMSTPA